MWLNINCMNWIHLNCDMTFVNTSVACFLSVNTNFCHLIVWMFSKCNTVKPVNKVTQVKDSNKWCLFGGCFCYILSRDGFCKLAFIFRVVLILRLLCYILSREGFWNVAFIYRVGFIRRWSLIQVWLYNVKKNAKC